MLTTLKAADSPLPTASEIRAKIPPGGISIQDLLKLLPGNTRSKDWNVAFQGVLKSCTRFDKARRVLLPMDP